MLHLITKQVHYKGNQAPVRELNDFPDRNMREIKFNPTFGKAAGSLLLFDDA